MSKITATLVTITTASALSAYYFYNSYTQEVSKSQGLEVKVSELSSNLQKIQAQLDSAQRRNQTEISADIQSVQDLKNQLQSQRDKTEKLRQALEDARANLRDRKNLSSKDSLQKEKAYIDDLKFQLQKAQKSLSDLNHIGSATTNADKQQARADQAQMDQQIQDQQAQVTQLETAYQIEKTKTDAVAQALATEIEKPEFKK